MTTQHTPGPWMAESLQSTNGADIAICSPAALAALELAQGWIDEQRDDEQTGEGQQARWILETIRAALASARATPTDGPAQPIPASRGKPEAKRWKPVCRSCGSEDVRADAYAIWDGADQKWDIDNVFDKGAFCVDCDGETRIDWQELTD